MKPEDIWKLIDQVAFVARTECQIDKRNPRLDNGNLTSIGMLMLHAQRVHRQMSLIIGYDQGKSHAIDWLMEQTL